MPESDLKTKIDAGKSAYGAAGYAQAGSSLVQLYLGFAQADLVRQQAQTQARIADFNARLTEYDGWKQEKYGKELIARNQSQNDQVAGTMRVQAAAAGVDLNEGSISEIKEENELTNVLNISDITNRVSESVMGFKRQASQLRLGADLTRLQGDVQARSLQTGGIVGALGTAASAAESFGKYYSGGEKPKTGQTIKQFETELDAKLRADEKKNNPTGYNITKFKVENEDKTKKLMSNGGRIGGRYYMMPGGGE